MRQALRFTALSLILGCAAAGCGIGIAPPVPVTQETTIDTANTSSTVTIDSTPGTHTPGWLYAKGNHIFTSDGHAWHGRGANIQDTRSCGACPQDSDPNEVMRRIDELVDNWGANFLRLTLESDTGEAVLNDPNYLAGIQAIVQHIGTKPGVYVMISVWADPSLSSEGWPTTTTQQVWMKLAQAFGSVPYVLYGIANEPQDNYDGSEDAQVWNAMNAAVSVIRAAEAIVGSPQHMVAVQGTGGFARFLDYYETHPIAAGSGTNIAYEVHVYDASSTFTERFVQPSQTLPVVIGEYGPVAGSMTTDDCAALETAARAAEVPYLAWTFHQACPPSLIEDNAAGGCGIGMSLAPSPWGVQVLQDLSKPW